MRGAIPVALPGWWWAREGLKVANRRRGWNYSRAGYTFLLGAFLGGAVLGRGWAEMGPDSGLLSSTRRMVSVAPVVGSGSIYIWPLRDLAGENDSQVAGAYQVIPPVSYPPRGFLINALTPCAPPRGSGSAHTLRAREILGHRLYPCFLMSSLKSAKADRRRPWLYAHF